LLKRGLISVFAVLRVYTDRYWTARVDDVPAVCRETLCVGRESHTDVLVALRDIAHTRMAPILATACVRWAVMHTGTLYIWASQLRLYFMEILGCNTGGYLWTGACGQVSRLLQMFYVYTHQRARVDPDDAFLLVMTWLRQTTHGDTGMLLHTYTCAPACDVYSDIVPAHEVARRMRYAIEFLILTMGLVGPLTGPVIKTADSDGSVAVLVYLRKNTACLSLRPTCRTIGHSRPDKMYFMSRPHDRAVPTVLYAYSQSSKHGKRAVANITVRVTEGDGYEVDVKQYVN
jgi:hypothetical protein